MQDRLKSITSRQSSEAGAESQSNGSRGYLGKFTDFVLALSETGITDYPPDIRRRLKIINLISALIALTTFIYAIHLWSSGDEKMMPIVYINLALAFFVSLVPLAHRINDIAGGLLLVISELVALLFFTSFFGRTGGAPLQYVVFAAAPFVVYDRRRLPLVLAIVVAALILHLVAWFKWPTYSTETPIDTDILNSLYVQGAVTTFGLIAASIYYAFSLVERAKAETETVLRNVLPDQIVERLKTEPGQTIADTFPNASVLFADITGFVKLARELGPERTVAILNELVVAFDQLAQKHGVEKIKTIGDAYMVASGVPEPRDDHLPALAHMALDMRDTLNDIAQKKQMNLNARFGMASGPMMAGIIGTKKFSYDVWGDPVNLASRLESLSGPGQILVCPTCYEALHDEFSLEARGKFDVKGVGQQEAWVLQGRKKLATAPQQAS